MFPLYYVDCGLVGLPLLVCEGGFTASYQGDHFSSAVWPEFDVGSPDFDVGVFGQYPAEMLLGEHCFGCSRVGCPSHLGAIFGVVGGSRGRKRGGGHMRVEAQIVYVMCLPVIGALLVGVGEE